MYLYKYTFEVCLVNDHSKKYPESFFFLTRTFMYLILVCMLLCRNCGVQVQTKEEKEYF